MKNYFIIIFTFFLFSCSSDDNKPDASELIGKWKLIEQLADPGDGSGTFNPITSKRTIEFFSNGAVIANGTLCYMSSEVGEASSGTYLKVDGSDFSDGEIMSDSCEFDETKVYYKLEESNLILWYQCIEGCGQKFIKN